MGKVLSFPPQYAKLADPPGTVSPCVLLATMRRYGIPLTAENYIDLACAGGAEWTAEHELPPELEFKVQP